MYSFCSLGCGIGFGYLHRIPKRQFPTEKNETSIIPAAAAAITTTTTKNADGFSEVSSRVGGWVLKVTNKNIRKLLDL